MYTYLKELLYRFYYKYICAHCYVGVQLHLLESVTGMYRCQLETAFVMQALAWLLIVPFKAIQFGAVHFGTGHMNLRQPHIFKRQI
jgi:hypothetical protein